MIADFAALVDLNSVKQVDPFYKFTFFLSPIVILFSKIVNESLHFYDSPKIRIVVQLREQDNCTYTDPTFKFISFIFCYSYDDSCILHASVIMERLLRFKSLYQHFFFHYMQVMLLYAHHLKDTFSTQKWKCFYAQQVTISLYTTFFLHIKQCSKKYPIKTCAALAPSSIVSNIINHCR